MGSTTLKDIQQSLVLVPGDEVSQIISTEANYDRWATFLFPHTKSTGLAGRRKKTWAIDMPDGSTGQAQIEVIPAQDEKCYTEKTYGVFLAIMDIWQEMGMPDDPMVLFISDIARKLRVKINGRVSTGILNDLRCLEETKVSWVFSFQTREQRDDTYKNKRILDTFDYTQKVDRVRGVTSARCHIRLSQHIRDNFRDKVTIPVNFAARMRIRSSIARTLYSRVDNILAKRDKYERTAVGLVADLSMVEARYKHLSQRKGLVLRLQKCLDGVELSKIGVFLKVDVVQTSNSADWKCVFRKTGDSHGLLADSSPSKSYHMPIIKITDKVRESLIMMIDEAVGGRDTNYGLYNTFTLYYSQELIMRAISEFKEIERVYPIQNKMAYFTSTMHMLAHKTGKDWFKPENCGEQCQYRPQNQLKMFEDNWETYPQGD